MFVLHEFSIRIIMRDWRSDLQFCHSEKTLLNILSGNINFVSANIFMMPLGKKTTLQIIMFSL